ncbi:hypothetical protein [Wukongibacter sp. M2B1]|uniref:hypothetical protein n=1 Tax=Wukongibacter sp. M2B1 TaxID=3088895 RepID=UPI003D795CE4
MNIGDKNRLFIVNKNSEEKWTFFILENSIYYKTSNKDLSIIEEKLVEDVKSFDIGLDTEENIHIVFVTNGGELGYLHHINKAWTRKILKKFNPSSNSIDFVNIIVFDKYVHIFYSFKNIINNNLFKTIHLYNNSLKWTYSHLDLIPQIKDSDPYFIDYDTNGNIYFLYKKPTSKNINFYLRIFSSKKNNWKAPTKLQLSQNLHDVKLFFVDSKSNYHLFFVSNKIPSNLYHISKTSNNTTTSPSLILSQNSESLNHKVFECNNKIWVLWKNTDNISYKSSPDLGINWEETKTLALDNLNNIDFIGFKHRSKNIIKSISTFGYLKDDDLYLLGLDNLDDYNKKPVENLELAKESPETHQLLNHDSNNDIFEASEIESIESDNKKTNNEEQVYEEHIPEDKSFINKIIDFLSMK